MLNHIVLMGRLVRDPEMRYTQSQIPVTSFRIAVDRDYGGRDGAERQADFIDIVAWRQTAEFVSKYFTKGRMAVVSGRLQIREWTDRDGNKRYSAEVVADNVYFGDSKGSRDDNGGSYNGGGYQSGGGYNNNNSYRAPAPAQQGGDSYRSFDNAPSGSAFSDLSDADGELPF
jgi:single-strand DNA-binding protein